VRIASLPVDIRKVTKSVSIFGYQLTDFAEVGDNMARDCLWGDNPRRFQFFEINKID